MADFETEQLSAVCEALRDGPVLRLRKQIIFSADLFRGLNGVTPFALTAAAAEETAAYICLRSEERRVGKECRL